jgi:hypothetical protein
MMQVPQNLPLAVREINADAIRIDVDFPSFLPSRRFFLLGPSGELAREAMFLAFFS